MKKIIILIVLFIYQFGTAQCTPPSDFTIITNFGHSVQLDWTENSIANTWEVATSLDYSIGTPLPTTGISTNTHPFWITGLIPQCMIFYVRSVCTTGNYSPWTAIASSNCPPAANVYISTLSNESFSLNSDNNFKVFPNPTTDQVYFDNTQYQFKTVIVNNYLGQEILNKKLNSSDQQNINITNFPLGIYLLKFSNNNKSIIKTIIKK